MATTPPSAPNTGASVAASPPGGDDRGLGQLLSDMTSQMGTLVRQEIELAKVETKEEVTRAGKAAGMMAGAGFSAYLALLFLSLALAWLLDQVMNRALAFAIVGVLYGVVGGLLFVVGRRQLKLINPVPQQTVATLKEDVEWAKAQKN
jgi:uncharacterized membrane protein YqjE